MCACPTCCTAASCGRAGRAPTALAPRSLSIDESSISDIPGARVVRKGDFIGVVAEREWDAVRAAQKLKVTWQVDASLPGNAGLFERDAGRARPDTVIVDDGDAGEGLYASRARGARATYQLPYQAHLPFGPNCAIADVAPDGALVMSSTQDVYNSRAHAGGRAGPAGRESPRPILRGLRHVRPQLLRGCPQAAAIMSQLAGRPVRVQFMRWDEHGWDNFGPAAFAEVRAAIDADGRIIAYEYHGWQHGWFVIETSQEFALRNAAEERAGRLELDHRQPDEHRRDVCDPQPPRHQPCHPDGSDCFKGAPLRSPMDMPFSFASEQVIDELAYAAGMDPLEFRRRNIADERWLGVLNAAAAAAGWTPRIAASNLSDAEVVTGRGIGIGTHHVSFGAAVAEIEVNSAPAISWPRSFMARSMPA